MCSSGYCQMYWLLLRKVEPTQAKASHQVEYKISLVFAFGFHATTKQKDSKYFIATVWTINKLLNDSINSQIELANLRKIVPPECHKFLPLFNRYVDHAIDLLLNTKASFGPLYFMSEAELKEFCGWINENLYKGFICLSTSSAASSFLFIKKPGGLRLSVHYWALNKITKKNQYLLPLIEANLSQIQGARIEGGQWTSVPLHPHLHQGRQWMENSFSHLW